MQEAQEFLDCEILTKTGTLLTNKCFLGLSGLFQPVLKQCDQNKVVVFLPNHTRSEIQEELFGFVKTEKILKVQSECESETQGDVDEINKTVIMMTEAKSIKSAQMITKSIPISSEGLQNNVTPKKRNSNSQPQCEFCGKTFVNSKQCRMHRYQVHTEKLYNCHICSATLKTKSILMNHLKTHNESMFSCKFCQRVRAIAI